MRKILIVTVQIIASIYRNCLQSACVAQVVIIFTPSEMKTGQQGFKPQIQVFFSLFPFFFFSLKENLLFFPFYFAEKKLQISI